MHYMILMSEKMASQKKLGEIKLVPYNKPLIFYVKQKLGAPKSTYQHNAQTG